MVSSDYEGLPFRFYPTKEELIEHYLKIKLNAPDEKSMHRWSDSVYASLKSCFKEEFSLHTQEKLVAYDKPKFSSKTVGCTSYFLLKTNKNKVVRKGQQFDLRDMLEEFKRKAYGWKDWRPGMEIEVSLVRREQIPSYLFTKANHNELQRAPNHCAVEDEVGHAVDIGKTIM